MNVHLNNICLTVYLTGRDDPQHYNAPRPPRWAPDCDETVRIWIESLTRCGLKGIIFHDELSDEFIQRWTSTQVHFVRVTWSTPWTAAEERVQIYHDWLCMMRHYDWVCTTDLSDVEFHRSPFDVMWDPGVVYIGSETNTIGEVTLMQDWMRRTYGHVTNGDRIILNPGIVAGQSQRLLDFLGRWIAEMQRAITPTPPPHDIVAFNRLLYRERIPYITGHPLHTTFRQNEGPESGAAIRHK